MSKQIYAIYDNVAAAIIGGLHLHSHAAPAVRMFSDIASDPKTALALHPNDFDLILLGLLNDDTTITPAKEIVLTGANWLAAQTPRDQGENANAIT